MDRHWHGIRSAAAFLRGGGLGISHKNESSPEKTRRVDRLIGERQMVGILDANRMPGGHAFGTL
jgi:hypothetical protein